jgi:hypothetical protein
LWLISLLYLFFLFGILRKRAPLTIEERVLAWLGILLFVLSVSFQAMDWLSVTPAFLVPYITNVVYVFVLVGAVAISALVGRRTKKPQTVQGIETIRHKAAEPASPRYVESGTPIIPKNGEPIILTSQLLAGMDFYPSRKELQTQAPIEDVIKGARSSVDLLGFTIESWSVGVRDTIRKALKDGKHFRFIILSPAFKSIKEADDLNQRINLQGRISESLRMLQTIKSELSDVERGRLDIRIHDLLPIHSIVAIDAESERGVIYVEYYVYGTDSRSWVTLGISKKEQGALFDRFWQSYRYIWERSKTWP